MGIHVYIAHVCGVVMVKPKTRSQIINGLKKLMPEMWVKKAEEYSSFGGGGIVVTSEDEKSHINGIPAFDYYEEAHQLSLDAIDEFEPNLTPEQRTERRKQVFENPTYINGIHTEVYSFLEKHGWTNHEWETSGTLVLSKAD
jgi:hypothetical protein